MKRRLCSQGGVCHGGWQCQSPTFRQYAEGALLWVAQSKTEEEERLLLELARTWRKAAIVSVAVVSGTQERPMPRLDEGKEFGTADRARAHADELAAQLGGNKTPM